MTPIEYWLRVIGVLLLFSGILGVFGIIGWAIAFAPGKRKEEKYGNGHNDGI